jgi:hypothetical protein
MTIKNKWPQNKPNGRKIDQMAIKSTITRPSKIDPKWDFWFENIPSGNPALEKKVFFYRRKKLKLENSPSCFFQVFFQIKSFSVSVQFRSSTG